jgi:hypothetical protein
MALQLTAAQNSVNYYCAELNYVGKIILSVLLVVILRIVIALNEILLSSFCE